MGNVHTSVGHVKSFCNTFCGLLSRLNVATILRRLSCMGEGRAMDLESLTASWAELRYMTSRRAVWLRGTGG